MKQGTDYELFVKEVYEALHSAEGIENVSIEHDVKLKGTTGTTHQIDVYWQFTQAGIPYRVAVECKDYQSRVSQEKINAFHSILEDIGGIIGIYATKTGFQKGAIISAKAYGIQLMEIRHPNDNDWSGRIRTIDINFEIRMIDNVRRAFSIDKEWCKKKNIQALKIDTQTDGIFIYDKECNCKKSLHQIENELSRDIVKSDIEETYEYADAYLQWDDKEVKINQLKLIYDVVESSESLVIRGDDIVKAITKNIQTEETYIITFDGKVKPRKP